MPEQQNAQTVGRAAISQGPVDVRHLGDESGAAAERLSARRAIRLADYRQALRLALPLLPVLIVGAMLFGFFLGLAPTLLAVEALAASVVAVLWFATRRLALSRRRAVYWWLLLAAACAALAVPWWQWLLHGPGDWSQLGAAAGLALSLMPLAMWWLLYLMVAAGLGLTALLGPPPVDGLLPSLVLMLSMFGGLPAAVSLLRRRQLESRSLAQAQALADLKEKLADQQQRVRYEQDQRHNMERSLRSVRELADSASHAKTEFLATISHEIRTPLNGILPILEMLEGTELNPEQRRYVHTAFNSSRHLMRIIDDILDFAKAESGKLQLESIEVDVRELIESVMELMQGSADSKGLSLQLEIDEQLPARLRSDPIRVRQILINLLSNAIKFTETGSVLLRVAMRHATRKEVELHFEVIDSGIGMSRETARKLFQSFTQADASTTRKHGGTGLGLAICRRLVTLMGGRIGVRSQLGAGSTFWFVLPMRKSSIDVPAARQDLQGVRVLCCIGDTDTAATVRHQLRQWGAMAEFAAPDAVPGTLQDAAMLGSSWSFEMLLIDTWGLEQQVVGLLRRIRSDALLRKLHIAVAGRSEELLERLHRDFGVYHISGGLRPAPLKRCLVRLFDVEGGGSATPLGPAPDDYRDLNLEREFSLHEMEVTEAAGSSDARGTVLLVEDNPVNLGVVRRVLQRLGARALVAHNGREALEQLQRGDIDLVFMDCQMPVMDGYQATREWRRLEGDAERPLPIVAMTANAMQGDRERCLQAGMDDYLAKPVSVAQVQAALQRWLPERFPADGAQVPAAGGPASDDMVVLDPGVLAELREVMDDGFDGLVRTYLDNTPQLLDELDRAAGARDLVALVIPAHSLKSSSANLGATQLSTLARSIEIAAREGRLEDALAAHRQVGEAATRTREALLAQLKSN